MIAGGEALSVLLVEDNAIDTRVLLRDLQRYEDTAFEVESVSTLSACLAAVGRQEFDCVLLDMNLPDSMGLDTVRAVLDHDEDLAIVILTGLGDPTTAVESVALGAQDYLVKGQADHDGVGRAIRYTVARHRAEQELRAAQARLDVLRDRERIARDLHDTVIQQLFATGMGLQSVAKRIDDDHLHHIIALTITEIDASIRQLREAVYDLNTVEPVTKLSDEIKELIEARCEPLGLTPEVTIDPLIDEASPGVGDDLRATLTEALTNVAKHGEATTVEVVVKVDESVLHLRVADNGRGITQRRTESSGALKGRGLGNMRSRAERHEGWFELSSSPSGGAVVGWHVPLSRS